MEIKIGLLGFGRIGRVHAHAWRSIPMYYGGKPCRIRLVGVAEPDAALAAHAVQQAGFEWSTSDPDELISHRDINVIDICTPNAYHAEALRSALAAGKHIYCEKPLARELREAEEISALANRTTGQKQLVSQFRYLPAVMKARALWDAGLVGEPFSMRGVHLQSGSLDNDGAHDWRLRKSIAGGGILMDVGPHILDLARYFLGDIEAVNTTTRSIGAGRRAPSDVEDAAWSMVRFQNGCVGTLEMNRVCAGAQDELELEINGSRGALRFHLQQPNVLEIYDRTRPVSERGWQTLTTLQQYPEPADMPDPLHPLGWIRAHIAAQFAFADAIANNKPVSPTFDDGVKILQVIQAMYQSASSGCWVSLSESAS